MLAPSHHTFWRMLMGVCLLSVNFVACHQAPSEPPPQSKIGLSVEEVNCTDVWLKLSVGGLGLPAIILQRDGAAIDTLHLTATDTTIQNSGVVPGKDYTYLAQFVSGAPVVGTSDPVQVRTLDTTNGNFTFTTTLLGDGNSSVLYDCQIVSTNPPLAFACGEIYKKDSLGNLDPESYNVAKWDGFSWELLKIPFVGACSGVRYPPIRAMWAFASDNVLFSNGGSIVRYDGTNATMDCSMNALLTGAINRLFALSPQEVYAVGNAGTVVRFSNGVWQKLTSGTTIDIKDIWGSTNSGTGKTEIACVASFGPQVPQGRMVLGVEGNIVRTLVDQGLPENLFGIWFDSNGYCYLTGSGIYRKHLPITDNEAWQVVGTGLESYHTRSVRGIATNDVFHAGDFGEVIHFNGISYRSYRTITGLADGSFNGTSAKDHYVIAVGYSGDKAVVTVGQRP